MPVANLTTWLPLAFLVFGLLFLLLGVRTVLAERRRRRRWQEYPGRVVGSRLDDGHFQSRVAYVRDGHEFVFWNRFTSTTVTDPVGREVTVLANPDDPSDAVVSTSLLGGTAVGVGLALFGVLAAIVGATLLR